MYSSRPGDDGSAFPIGSGGTGFGFLFGVCFYRAGEMYMAGVPLRYMKRVAGAGFLLVTLLFVDVVFAPDGWRLPLKIIRDDAYWFISTKVM
jgi:hypothetical protein